MYPHDDALVVTLLIANYTTRRVLVDNGSSTDILFGDSFTRMGISPDRLRPSTSQLKGFSREVIQPISAITLLVMAGQDGSHNHQHDRLPSGKGFIILQHHIGTPDPQ